MKKSIGIVMGGVMAGFMLSIGCAVKLSVDNAVAGSFLFSLGLFAIITFGFGLFTGKAGYMAVNPPSYIGEVALVLLGNFIGTAIGGTLLHITRFGAELSSAAAGVMAGKMSDGPLSMVVLAVFCGVLMFTAVDGSKRLRENKNFAGSLFIICVPVMVFILCGFNHSIADMGYFFISGCADAGKAPLYFVMVIIGNALGCMAIPAAEKIIKLN